MNLNDVHQGIQKNKSQKRIGRGPGSGHGKTATRGSKGQGSRSGYSSMRVFRGRPNALGPPHSQTRFQQQLRPNAWPSSISAIWSKISRAAKKSRPKRSRPRSLAKGSYDLLKVLGDGELTKSLKISAHRFSRSALEKIEKAGGQAVVLPGKAPVVKNKMKTK